MSQGPFAPVGTGGSLALVGTTVSGSITVDAGGNAVRIVNGTGATVFAKVGGSAETTDIPVPNGLGAGVALIAKGTETTVGIKAGPAMFNQTYGGTIFAQAGLDTFR